VPRKEVKVILFDLDGILIDSLDAWHHVFNDTLCMFGLPALGRRQFSRGFGAPIEHDMKAYFQGLTIKEVHDAHNSHFRKRIHLVKLFPSAIPLLKEVRRRKLKAALISNSTRAIVGMIVSHYKLKKYLDVMVTMDDVRHRKPAPDAVLRACRELGVKPGEAVLVGDTQNDMVAGRRAGCITVGLKTKGDYTIRTLASLLPLIQRFK